MRADHVGADEIVGPENRAIDVRFRREVHHRVDAIPLEQTAHRPFIANIPTHEHVARIALQSGEILEVAGIRQGIENHHLPLARAIQPMAHEVRADEAGAPGDAQVTRREAHPASSSSCGANGPPVLRPARASHRY